MTIDNKDGAAFLAYVTDKLETRIAHISQSILEGQKDIEGMHEYYWENYTEMDQYGYENFDNQQALLHQINANEQQIHLRKRFRKMLDSPFFGRVDFVFEGDEEPEIFYIGIGNFAEEAGHTPLIYDWRAPVSGLFYDYDKGPASYQAPLGTICGEIASKWQYKIRNGRMIYQFESDVKIDDEILMAELGSGGSTALKNIVRTIQKEQNAIIRNTKDKIMVIQGAAGSGKTSIALHRIAYLLYHDRKNLKSSNILILSPNSIFSDYISHILPELGEENIKEMSFDLFAYRQLKDTVSDCEDRYDQIERSLNFPDMPSLYKEKQSREFLNRMEGYLTSLEDELMDFRDVEYKNFTKKEEEIIDLFYFKFQDIPLLSRMEAVAENFIDEVETLRDNDMDEEERAIVMEKFMNMYETQDLYVIYSRFLESCGYPGLPHVQLQERKLRYEDVYPVLYMKYRLLRQTSHNGIKHLVVDEMQDYSPIQYKVIQKLYPCRKTILGDASQSVNPYGSSTADMIRKAFTIGEIMKLCKSYRSTFEITDFSQKIQTNHELEPIIRHGEPPAILRFEDVKQEILGIFSIISSFKKSGYTSLGIVCKTETQARELSESLRVHTGDIHFLSNQSSAFMKGIIVTSSHMAKGLEFDEVIVPYVNGKNYNSAIDKSMLYVAVTRAMHRLTLTYNGRPSEFIPASSDQNF